MYDTKRAVLFEQTASDFFIKGLGGSFAMPVFLTFLNTRIW